MQHGAEVFI